ncbi:SirB2 family protein [Sedimenticola selenatireducens]|uniref:SirB2 family protein n=1 Tax=Sedimenticola selenatireducens TaxID=191960 RepID=UPI001FE09B78|nr:SirB2 family protein [Sedimenticola selenatireducens]
MELMIYYWIKTLHVSTVIFTIGFFTLRFVWMLSRSRLFNHRWVRLISQTNDSLLLVAGIALAVMSRQYPFVAPWLTAKLAALLLYIVLGMFAFKWAGLRRNRILFGIMALLTAGYIVAVALTRLPRPWEFLLG